MNSLETNTILIAHNGGNYDFDFIAPMLYNKIPIIKGKTMM